VQIGFCCSSDSIAIPVAEDDEDRAMKLLDDVYKYGYHRRLLSAEKTHYGVCLKFSGGQQLDFSDQEQGSTL
jgi:hypothetical protein